MRGRSHEAFWWTIFGAGGVIAALFFPVMIYITGIGGATGWDAVSSAVSHGDDGIGTLLHHAPVRAVLGLIMALAAFHAAHRIRHTLIDLHTPVRHGPLALASYGGAVILSAFTAVVLALF